MGAIDDSRLLRRHRITVDEYHRLGEAGVLAPDAHVELIDGEVIDMAPIGSRHWSVVTRLQRLIERAVGDRAVLATQSSVRLDLHNEPQPDLALFKPRDDFYASALPGPADTLLIIEVSDNTARYDRQIKLPLYARHRVAEVWIVDLEAGVLHMFREPAGERYLQVTETALPGTTGIHALPGVSLDLAGLFG